MTRYAWSRAAVDVTHELAGVGGNESDAVGSDVEENALHDDAVFVGADGKHGIVETGNHLLGGDGEAHGLAGCLRCELGVLVGGSTHEAVMAAEVRELHFETVVVNVDANALFGNLFEEFDQTACTEAYAALASCVLDGEACRESVLLVAAGDCQLIAAESDEEIIEDSEGIP